MKSLWNDDQARAFAGDPLAERVYTSQLLGREPALVLHGGGNTSVKASIENLFGDQEQVLYVKGSGWDLATIEAAGFPAVRLDVLIRMAQLDALSDIDMVKGQRAAMLDPSAPNPSVEAILHAVIPYRFVDHTHADAVVTISNTADGAQRITTLYGDRVMVVPYVMPGFELAKTIYDMTREIDWRRLHGIVLLNHGVFTFADDARTSYERMVDLVDKAENYLREQGAATSAGAHHDRQTEAGSIASEDLLTLATIRKQVSAQLGAALVARNDCAPATVAFSKRPDLEAVTSRGPLTPDHVIRTKPIPMLVGDNPQSDVADYAKWYREYFDKYDDGTLTCLDTAPRWALWPGRGALAFGRSSKDADVILDILRHTLPAIEQAEQLGGWQVLDHKDLFEVEYWALEQAKLKKHSVTPPLQGKVALVTGADSGIGRACVEELLTQGAAVVGLDVHDGVTELSNDSAYLGQLCDITDAQRVRTCVDEGVCSFGGIDILVNNAGIFPAGQSIEELDPHTWQQSLNVNLSAQQNVLQCCIPYLKLGVDPSAIFVASKNVPAPGPGAAAYSVAKAGVTQLARVAALELAQFGIRVNVLHPDAVYDTRIWTAEVLENRARHYGMTVQAYKTKNLLGTEITSRDVAALVCTLAGPLFGKTTGAQIPIDGGNDRVI